MNKDNKIQQLLWMSNWPGKKGFKEVKKLLRRPNRPYTYIRVDSIAVNPNHIYKNVKINDLVDKEVRHIIDRMYFHGFDDQMQKEIIEFLYSSSLPTPIEFRSILRYEKEDHPRVQEMKNIVESFYNQFDSKLQSWYGLLKTELKPTTKKGFVNLSYRDKALFYVMHGSTNPREIDHVSYENGYNKIVLKHKRIDDKVSSRAIKGMIKAYYNIIPLIEDNEALIKAIAEKNELLDKLKKL